MVRAERALELTADVDGVPGCVGRGRVVGWDSEADDDGVPSSVESDVSDEVALAEKRIAEEEDPRRLKTRPRLTAAVLGLSLEEPSTDGGGKEEAEVRFLLRKRTRERARGTVRAADSKEEAKESSPKNEPPSVSGVLCGLSKQVCVCAPESEFS